ncbi:MAG: DNA-processing protein DprA [Patescibacteria group bacterium]
MEINESKYWILVDQFPKFGPAAFKKLADYFSSMEKAYKSGREDLVKAGIKESTASEFIDFRKRLDEEKIWRLLEKEKIKTVKITDKNYPELLSQIYDPPPLLYWKGEDIARLNKEPALAVVGSRKYSAYGKQVTDSLIPEIANNKITVISGMALGIDSLAHYNTLKAGGKTVAILGSGLDEYNIYPPQNRGLMKKIIETGGTVISEFPPGTPPTKYTFPQRNRVVSGLSLGVLVVEAAKRSGALITAEFASDQGREIFAIPGNIYSPVSRGTNDLIKKGAHMITEAGDVMEILGIDPVANKETGSLFDNTPLSETEKRIIKILSFEPVSLDDIIKNSRLDTSTVNSTLSILEIKGIIKDTGNKKYILNDIK